MTRNGCTWLYVTCASNNNNIQDKKQEDSVEGIAPALCTNNSILNNKLIILNCQSLFPKKNPYFISVHTSDFIFGSESWLTDRILNSEVFHLTTQYLEEIDIVGI